MGCFEEDYEYVLNSGDLDEHNGRNCITPDYPNGTYAYFITLDDTLGPYYPYMIGETYYGDVYWNGPAPTTINIPGNVTEYTGPMVSLIDQMDTQELAVWPSPSTGPVRLRSTLPGEKRIRLIDLQGRVVFESEMSGETKMLQLQPLLAGVYLVEVEALDTGIKSRQRWVKQ